MEPLVTLRARTRRACAGVAVASDCNGTEPRSSPQFTGTRIGRHRIDDLALASAPTAGVRLRQQIVEQRKAKKCRSRGQYYIQLLGPRAHRRTDSGDPSWRAPVVGHGRGLQRPTTGRLWAEHTCSRLLRIVDEHHGSQVCGGRFWAIAYKKRERIQQRIDGDAVLGKLVSRHSAKPPQQIFRDSGSQFGC
eukprot:TRINITY_DN35882_c0_g1_i1.p2 TRINITY_DN35882_c0_g1~~TRINITY_DN35882_c0_g1_i1.p2  ORF type:complete len:191 (+),score=21.08 TRINITY_DN35882_c0_g1_i1:107-679(+)